MQHWLFSSSFLRILFLGQVFQIMHYFHCTIYDYLYHTIHCCSYKDRKLFRFSADAYFSLYVKSPLPGIISAASSKFQTKSNLRLSRGNSPRVRSFFRDLHIPCVRIRGEPHESGDKMLQRHIHDFWHPRISNKNIKKRLKIIGIHKIIENNSIIYILDKKLLVINFVINQLCIRWIT